MSDLVKHECRNEEMHVVMELDEDIQELVESIDP